MWEAIDHCSTLVFKCSTARVLVCVELTVKPAGDATSASASANANPYRYDVPVEQLAAYYFRHHAHGDHGFQDLFSVRLVARPLCLLLCSGVRLQAFECAVLVKSSTTQFLTPPSRVPLLTCLSRSLWQSDLLRSLPVLYWCCSVHMRRTQWRVEVDLGFRLLAPTPRHPLDHPGSRHEAR